MKEVAEGAFIAQVSRLCAGKLCIEVSPNSKMAWISEELCIGCGICVKVCLSVAQPLLPDTHEVLKAVFWACKAQSAC